MDSINTNSLTLTLNVCSLRPVEYRKMFSETWKGLSWGDAKMVWAWSITKTEKGSTALQWKWSCVWTFQPAMCCEVQFPRLLFFSTVFRYFTWEFFFFSLPLYTSSLEQCVRGCCIRAKETYLWLSSFYWRCCCGSWTGLGRANCSNGERDVGEEDSSQHAAVWEPDRAEATGKIGSIKSCLIMFLSQSTLQLKYVQWHTLNMV